jgi:ubiquinone biosynthesis protein
VAALAWPFLDRDLVAQPFPVQLRKRFERLGATYIKLGQILSLREDLLPPAVTAELKNLLDRLPVVPFPRFVAIVEADLGRPVDEVFDWIDPQPLGSASIAQTHRGTLLTGESVILKAVKPGIRDTLCRDAVLLRGFGVLAQLVLPRVRPKRMVDEFVHYTLREVDLRLEADNAETFAANFKDMPDVVFPRVYRQASGTDLLTMEYLAGVKATSPEAQRLSEEDRDRLVDLGASAIVRMLYRDGFFHADLHPGNLLILPGPRLGFIDLGMVGRFSEELRRMLLYYYFCLVSGDHDNAARYLSLIADAGPGGDPSGFRREVAEICRRWHRSANFRDFSLGQLIMESVARGVEFRMYFPVEMVLMVKALVTFEGVGQILRPGFDVAKVSQAHINRLLLHQLSPLRLAQEGLRGAPELFEAVTRAPMLISEGMRLLERQTRRPPENPFAGIRGTIFGGFCFLAGAILLASDGPVWAAAALFAVGLLLALRRGR